MSIQPEVLIHRDGPEWAHGVCGCLERLCDQAMESRRKVLIALSGGSTPQIFYRALSSPEWKERFDWNRMLFCFGDERCVPPDHPESNYGMTKAALFDPLGLRPEQIYRMKGELDEPTRAADDYERTLREITESPPPLIPHLDVILLGLGDDGHTASLFPGTSALADRNHLVAVGQSPRGVPSRITLTLGVINRASVVLFLVIGRGKAPMVRKVLEPRNEMERSLPATQVRPESGRLIWLLDESAGVSLSQRTTGRNDSRR